MLIRKIISWKNSFLVFQVVHLLSVGGGGATSQGGGYDPSAFYGKGSQTIKFGQLREYNIRNIFLEKSYTKCGGETISRPFSKESKLNSLDQECRKFYAVCFYFVLSRGLLKLLKLRCGPFA